MPPCSSSSFPKVIPTTAASAASTTLLRRSSLRAMSTASRRRSRGLSMCHPTITIIITMPRRTWPRRRSRGPSLQAAHGVQSTPTTTSPLVRLVTAMGRLAESPRPQRTTRLPQLLAPPRPQQQQRMPTGLPAVVLIPIRTVSTYSTRLGASTTTQRRCRRALPAARTPLPAAPPPQTQRAAPMPSVRTAIATATAS